jgi:hypothetical protein
MKGGLKRDIYKTLQKNLKLINKEISILETAQEKYIDKINELDKVIKEQIKTTTKKFKNKITTRSLKKDKIIEKEIIVREIIVQRLEDYDRALNRIVFGKKKI